MSARSADPIISPNQVMSAGLAATAASFVTSRFGVAGTLLGAALTAMIITGGSAILRSYLEAASGRVRGMPTKLRARRGQQEDGGSGGTMPGRPDLRDLPTLNRRSILIKGLLAAAVAFVICMGVVWGAEKVIGNSLSCGIWAKCPYGAVPGIHPAGYGDTGAGSSISGGSMNTGGVERPSLVDRVRQERNPFGDGQPVFGNPRNGGNPGGAASSASPDPGAGGQESAPPGAGQESVPPDAGQESVPPDAGQESASPKAGQQAAPSSASPAAGQ